jgi:hypothetical protein
MKCTIVINESFSTFGKFLLLANNILLTILNVVMAYFKNTEQRKKIMTIKG